MVFAVARVGRRNNINYLAVLGWQTLFYPSLAAPFKDSVLPTLITSIRALPAGGFLGAPQRSRRLCSSFLRSLQQLPREGTARFDPPNPFRIAKFTPITFPSRLNSGPPDPPEVVAAS